jgi:hypothetical protein
VDSDVQGAKPADVVPEGTPSNTEQASIEDKVKELVNKQVEEITRKFQSEKDKEIAKAKKETVEAQRRAQQYESVMQASKMALGDLEPDVAAKVRLAELEAKEKQYSLREQEEQTRKNWENTYNSFKTNLAEFVKSEGIDPSDKRIDWGDETEPLLAKQQRILASVVKIHKEDVKTSDQKIQERIKELAAKERKEAGLDSIDLSSGIGITGVTKDKIVAMSKETDPKKRAEILKNVDQIYADWKSGKIK